MKLRTEEPAAGPWRVEPIADVVSHLMGDIGGIAGRPAVVAVDGRSSSGKTSLARRLGEAAPGAAVVHTDDVAWRHSIFGWVDLLIAGVVEPARGGREVSYRPPAWDAHGRPGAIEVPAGIALLVVEGVGAARRQLATVLDAAIWVQSDEAQIQQREAARAAAGEVAASVQQQWRAEEVPFLAAQRPWERATLVVAGTPKLPHDPRTEVVVADRPG